MAEGEKFSTRFGYRQSARPITVREAAPQALREAIVQIAYAIGFVPSALSRLLKNS
jgi:hypothetical protein